MALRLATNYADREFVLAAVKTDPWAFAFASLELQADREVVLEAVKAFGYLAFRSVCAAGRP